MFFFLSAEADFAVFLLAVTSISLLFHFVLVTSLSSNDKRFICFLDVSRAICQICFRILQLVARKLEKKEDKCQSSICLCQPKNALWSFVLTFSVTQQNMCTFEVYQTCLMLSFLTKRLPSCLKKITLFISVFTCL